MREQGGTTWRFRQETAAPRLGRHLLLRSYSLIPLESLTVSVPLAPDADAAATPEANPGKLNPPMKSSRSASSDDGPLVASSPRPAAGVAGGEGTGEVGAESASALLSPTDEIPQMCGDGTDGRTEGERDQGVRKTSSQLHTCGSWTNRPNYR